MLTVAYLANKKSCKKILKDDWNPSTYVLLWEYTARAKSNEYQHDRVQIVFKNLWVLVISMKVASALEGLKYK